MIGRYTPADGDGAFANRINGAKIYASNDADTPGELVGEVSGVTATHSYIPQRIDLDTGGRSYQYFTLYFDTVNNGGKISLAVAELSFVVESEQEISFTPGDVDNDGSIHLSDAVLALKLSVAGSDGDTGHSQAFLSADVDGDGNVTTADVLKILKKANKKHVEELDG